MGDIKASLPESIEYQIFADDIKIYRAIRTAADCTALQSAIDCVVRWSTENLMLLSESKCLVFKTKPHEFRYHVNGVLLEEPTSVRDLGVTVEPTLRFRKHVVETARTSSVLCNLILRTFVCARPEFYITLYNSFVVSKLLYCSEVWSPHLSCEKVLLEKVQRRFLKFVARRCGVDPSSFSLPTIESLHRQADLRTFQKMVRTGEAAEFFRVTVNNRRSQCTYDPIAIANSDVVNNLFAWRTARSIRNNTLEIKEILN